MESSEKQIYQSIIENLSDGVIVVGDDGKILICNDAAYKMLALKPGSIIGKTMADLMTEIEGNDDLFEMLLDAVFKKKRISRTVSFRTPEKLSFLKATTIVLTEDEKNTAIITVLSDQTEVTELIIKNKSMATQIIALMNSFVEVMVTAFEERSTYNANHTKNMVRYATLYLEWLSSHGGLLEKTSSNTGPLLMSVWLHDIGKLLIPQEIMDKPTRLGSELAVVKYKIEITRLMLRNRMLSGEESKEATDIRLAHLDECESLIGSSNTAPFLDDETIGKLKAIAQTECLMSDGSVCPLLDEKELESITIVRGTLTAGERSVIESHASLTGKLLSKMEFVGEYKRVPQWAAGHHEFLDGSGYPGHLKGAQIPWETRLLTVIDIYDAMTADDRPYKPPMAPEKALAILSEMADQGRLDREIVDGFIESKAWGKEPVFTDIRNMTIDADIRNLDKVISFVESYLEGTGCTPKAQMHLTLATEEIFVNIAQYAYAPSSGPATVSIGISSDRSKVIMTFTDSGIPYDPLSKIDPDVTLSADEREIGGLGVYLVKKNMDDVRYKFTDGCNTLTVVKTIT